MTAAKRKNQNLRRSVTRLQETVDQLCRMCERAIRDIQRASDYSEALGREFGDIQTRRMAEMMHRHLSVMPSPSIVIPKEQWEATSAAQPKGGNEGNR